MPTSRPKTLPTSASACAARLSTRLAELPFDASERAALIIARHYFRSFAAPETQSWIAGIGSALVHFDQDRAPQVAVATLAAVQSMRQARRSVFRFNDLGCARCAAGITAHERAFLSMLAGIRRGRSDRASGHAVILCEGNDHAAVLRALGTLASLLPPVGQDHPA